MGPVGGLSQAPSYPEPLRKPGILGASSPSYLWFQMLIQVGQAPSEQIHSVRPIPASANPHYADGENKSHPKDLLKQSTWGQKENLPPCAGEGC